MTKDEVVRAIALAVTGGGVDKEAIAQVYLQKAILKIGRMEGVDFNREWVDFNLTSGISKYQIGTDIIGKHPEIWSLKELWRTDVQGWSIEIVGLERFNAYTRGGSSAGAPTLGTIHSEAGYLEVYPIPDSAYTVAAYLKKKITNFSEIEEGYHDVLIDYAVASINATKDTAASFQFAKEGLNDLKNDQPTLWSGNSIGIERHINATNKSAKGRRADSCNLRGV